MKRLVIVLLLASILLVSGGCGSKEVKYNAEDFVNEDLEAKYDDWLGKVPASPTILSTLSKCEEEFKRQLLECPKYEGWMLDATMSAADHTIGEREDFEGINMGGCLQDQPEDLIKIYSKSYDSQVSGKSADHELTCVINCYSWDCFDGASKTATKKITETKPTGPLNEELAKVVAGDWVGSFVTSEKECVHDACKTISDTGEFRFTIDLTDTYFSNLKGSGTGTSTYSREGPGFTCPEGSFDYSFTVPDDYGKYIKGSYNTYTSEWGSSPITSIDVDFNFPVESRFGDYDYVNSDCSGGEWTSRAYLSFSHGLVNFYLNESNILGLIEEGSVAAIEEILREGFEYKRESALDSSVYSEELSIRKLD